MKLSRLSSLQGAASATSIEAYEAGLDGSKAVLSEYGWAFLTNDTNAFLDVQFGDLQWSEAARAHAIAVFEDRRAVFAARGVPYVKFIVPEKSVVYREFLPRALEGLIERTARPATILQAAHPDIVQYLDDILIDGKSYGLTFFRGDSHVSWLGGWLVYYAMASWLRDHGALDGQEIVQLAWLDPSLAFYGGDLVEQVTADARARFDAVWGGFIGRHAFEQTVKLDLPYDRTLARRVATPPLYEQWFTGRETVVYERADKRGLRAVIFRDSTMDRSCELLAQHFARSVFVWHGGLVYEDVLHQERPDVVMHVMAERFIIRYDIFNVTATIKDFP